MQQLWINHPLNCIFENTIANFSPSILHRFERNFIWRYRIYRGRRLCYSFPNCFQNFPNFPEIFLNWKIFKCFLQNSSRAAYLSRFSLSIRNFMCLEKCMEKFATAFAVSPPTLPTPCDTRLIANRPETSKILEKIGFIQFSNFLQSGCRYDYTGFVWL